MNTDISNLLNDIISNHIDNFNNIKLISSENKYMERYIDRYFSLHQIFYNINDINDKISKEIMKFAISIDPDNILFISLLAEQYLQNNNQLKTEYYVNKALRLDPEFIYALYIKYNICTKYYESKDSLIVCEEILSLFPNNTFALYHITLLEIDPIKNMIYLERLFNTTKIQEESFKVITGIDISIKQYSKKTIFKLNQKMYMKLFYKNKDYYTEACGVCFDLFGKLNIVKLICGHYFHVYCVNTQSSCPTCREELIYLIDYPNTDIYDAYSEPPSQPLNVRSMSPDSD